MAWTQDELEALFDDIMQDDPAAPAGDPAPAGGDAGGLDALMEELEAPGGADPLEMVPGGAPDPGFDALDALLNGDDTPPPTTPPVAVDPGGGFDMEIDPVTPDPGMATPPDGGGEEEVTGIIVPEKPKSYEEMSLAEKLRKQQQERS
ncbi:MAG: hypothetical protein AAF492_21295, partial [Verrucomicrobiota bacterium]